MATYNDMERAYNQRRGFGFYTNDELRRIKQGQRRAKRVKQAEDISQALIINLKFDPYGMIKRMGAGVIVVASSGLVVGIAIGTLIP